MRDLLGIDAVLQAWPEGLDLVRVVVSRGQDLEEAENNLTTGNIFLALVVYLSHVR